MAQVSAPERAANQAATAPPVPAPATATAQRTVAAVRAAAVGRGCSIASAAGAARRARAAARPRAKRPLRVSASTPVGMALPTLAGRSRSARAPRPLGKGTTLAWLTTASAQAAERRRRSCRAGTQARRCGRSAGRSRTRRRSLTQIPAVQVARPPSARSQAKSASVKAPARRRWRTLACRAAVLPRARASIRPRSSPPSLASIQRRARRRLMPDLPPTTSPARRPAASRSTARGARYQARLIPRRRRIPAAMASLAAPSGIPPGAAPRAATSARNWVQAGSRLSPTAVWKAQAPSQSRVARRSTSRTFQPASARAVAAANPA